MKQHKKKRVGLSTKRFKSVQHSDPTLIPGWSPWPHPDTWQTDRRNHSLSTRGRDQ